MAMHAPPGYTPHRDAQVTPTNKGAVVDIAAWFVMVAFILAVMMRFAIKRFVMSVSLVIDDLLLFLAMVVDIVQVIFVSLSVHYGLGREQSVVSPKDFERFLKMVYATDLCYFIVACLAKTSILLLIERLCEAKEGVQKFCKATIVFVVCWALAGVFVVAFQCGAQQPWNSIETECLNMVAFWDAMGILDIVTELFIVACPLALIWGLPTPLKSRLVVAFAFCLRLWVVAAICVRLVDVRTSLVSNNLTFDNVYTSIATQVVLGLEIVTACTLVLKPFLHAFDSGMLGISLRSSRFSGVSGGYSHETTRALGSLGQDPRQHHERLNGTESRYMRRFHFPTADEEKEIDFATAIRDPFSLQNAGGLSLSLDSGRPSTGSPLQGNGVLSSYSSTTPLKRALPKGSVQSPDPAWHEKQHGPGTSHSRQNSGESDPGRVLVHFQDGRRPTIDHTPRSQTSGSTLGASVHLPMPFGQPSESSSMDISPLDEEYFRWMS